LFAVYFPYPLSRSVDATPQRLRSSTEEQREQLEQIVAEVMRRTGAPKVALVGSSRGGNAIRNYIKNGGGARSEVHTSKLQSLMRISSAVFCLTITHNPL